MGRRLDQEGPGGDQAPAIVDAKYCNKCKQVKPLPEWNRLDRAYDGLYWCCRACEWGQQPENQEKKKACNRASYWRRKGMDPPVKGQPSRPPRAMGVPETRAQHEYLKYLRPHRLKRRTEYKRGPYRSKYNPEGKDLREEA